MLDNSDVQVAYVCPENLHSQIVYPIAIVKDSKHPKIAEEFIEFVIGNK
ncbi:MAG: extracellular solute-binding protein [Methanosarcinales archaeon]